MPEKENDPDEIISLDAVCEFLQKHGGKVRQVELVNHFRSQLNSSATKVRARQEFKDILQLITANKTENGEKFIILVKNSQTSSTSNSVIIRRSQRPLSIRKEIGRSRGENLLLPSAPRVPSDEEDGRSLTDSGMGSDTSSIRTVSSLKQEIGSKLPDAQSMDSLDTLMDGEEDDDLEEDLGLVGEGSEVLPEEKEWMLAAAHGDLTKLEKLLKEYPSLGKKKDFVMGYTALHWAAKLGRTDIVKFIMNAGVDIHTKSHGGYTPLHIAAMSGRDQVIIQLIELFNANIHARDHSGKKARDVVRETVAADVQRKLGRSLILDPNTVLDSKIIAPTLRRNLKPVRSRPSSFIKALSDGEMSPRSTPEVVRKNIKSIGASAQRSMSFLKKKKKDRLREETLSPRQRRKTSSTNDGDHPQDAPWKKEWSEKKKRPKSGIEISSPTEVSEPSTMTPSDPSLGESTLSFEI